MVAPSVIVVGGGTMGLACAWVLARRGLRVTVLERFEHVHANTSHGGYTRIIRQAYHEGSGYVPLVQEAERLWLELEARAGARLLVRTGLLEFGPSDDPELRAAIDACRCCGVEHEMVEPEDARARWPFAIRDGWTACLTPSGGYLRVQACFDALREEARAAGAQFRYGVKVNEVACGGEGVHVLLEDGALLPADHVVVTAGVYTDDVVPGFLPGRLRCLRRVLAWTRPESGRAALERLPVWGAFLPGGFFYGFPWNSEGVDGLKLAVHTTRAIADIDVPVDPETVDREARPADLDPLTDFLRDCFVAGLGPVVSHKTCMYSVTPGWDFVIDAHPSDDRVVVAGGFSGHGFKFAPVVGEIVADLLEHRAPRWPLQIFRRAHHL